MRTSEMDCARLTDALLSFMMRLRATSAGQKPAKADMRFADNRGRRAHVRSGSGTERRLVGGFYMIEAEGRMCAAGAERKPVGGFYKIENERRMYAAGTERKSIGCFYMIEAEGRMCAAGAERKLEGGSYMAVSILSRLECTRVQQ